MAEGEKPARWYATTGFRITLLHLVLTLLGTVLLAGIAFWATSRFAEGQIRAEVERDVRVLLNAGALGGPASIALSIEARIAADRSGTQYFLLSAPDGGRIAGNLAAAPRQAGWTALDLDGGTTESVLLAFGAPLPAGHFLLVGRDLAPVRGLQSQLLGAAGWVGGAALLLALAGGLLVGRGVVRRAAQMERALADVEAGRLGTRLPARPGGDEFDRLARRLNATLDRLQGTMAALRQVTDDIAHDLRTPLTRLRQRLESLSAATPAAAAGLEAAVAECDRILDVFAALLRIAQVESGARRAAFAAVDLTAVLETVAELHASATAERGQTLATDLAPGIRMQGDRDLLAQMVSNLVGNAILHGRAGGHVALALRRAPGGGAEITVTDDGPGIPDAEKPLVLRRFHRLDAARTTPGSGLGLALVAAVAELHGMVLTLEDASPGLRVRLGVPQGG
ncbi:sensor histidine kinase [Falsiroseomonas sp. E2-1-a20]|uniref:sensor histidine kinase n=1 Tax=Falsiroseomonas sp. E2-1-a20 TaxID=3239300 RepID=UPI003F33A7A7